MPQGINGFHKMLVVTCELTNFCLAFPMKDEQAATIAEFLFQRVFSLFGPPQTLIVDEGAALTGLVITILCDRFNISLKTISPCNHGSSKTEERIKQLQRILTTTMREKGRNWPEYVTVSTFALNTFASPALDGYSPWELVFARPPPNLLNLDLTPFQSFHTSYRSYAQSLAERVRVARAIILRAREDSVLRRYDEAHAFQRVPTFNPGDLVGLFAPHVASLQTNTRKFRQDFVGPLVVVKRYPDDTYVLKRFGTNELLSKTYPVVRIRSWSEQLPNTTASTEDQVLKAAEEAKVRLATVKK
jgi:hypothetical protein